MKGLIEHHYGAYLITEFASGKEKTALIQSDWDYPSFAQAIGWNIRNVQIQNACLYGAAPCKHSGTDGTVTCPDCGLTATTFIREAAEYIDGQVGSEIELSNIEYYFENDNN